MQYEQRFTEIMTAQEGEEIEKEPSYYVRASADVIANRLGLYEDLGFSPAELAKILLDSDMLDPSQKDIIRIALMRIQVFDSKGYYLKESYAP